MKSSFICKVLAIMSCLGIFKASAQSNAITIDTAYLKCEYKMNYTKDTTALKMWASIADEFILQVGRTFSKYYSKKTDAYERMMIDPEAKAAEERETELALANGGMMRREPLARWSPLVIYSNYPENKRTIQDAIFFDYYIYEDDTEPQQWDIVPDSVKTILDYQCRKAICSYRGRNYEAWYCPEIPVSLGPWKFSGLPGLIMNIQDKKRHYVFKITGIIKVKEPIEYFEYDRRRYAKTERVSFLKANAKAERMGLTKYIEANYTAKDINRKIEMTDNYARYDLLERDYKK